MTSKTFIDQVTVVDADWLNDVNSAIYDGTVVYTADGVGTVPRTVRDKLRALAINTGDFDYAGSSDEQELRAAAVALVARGGGVLYLDPGRTYTIWPSGNGATIFDFTGADGITIEGQGATLSAGNVNSSAPIVFNFSGAKRCTVRNLKYVQSYITLDNVNGATLFHMDQGGQDFIFENIEQVGGLRGIHCLGTVVEGGTPVERVTATNCKFTHVYYPQQFRMSGNSYFARGIRTINCGRGYFPFNVRDHDVDMFSQHGGPFDDCLLKNYTYAAEYNALENIRLRYHTDGRYATGSDQLTLGALIALEFQLVDAVAGKMTNIDIEFIIKATAVKPPNRVFIMRKYDAASVPDTSPRGHTVNNLRVSGRVENWQYGAETGIEFFSTTGYNWTGDFANNITIENLSVQDSVATQSAIIVNGQPFGTTANLSMQNIRVDGNISRINWDPAYTFDAENVVAPNLKIVAAWQSYTPIWAASGTAVSLGDGVIAGKFHRSGDRVNYAISLTMGSTTTFGTGAYSFSIPVISANTGISSWGNGLLLDLSPVTRCSLMSEVLPNSSTARLWTNDGIATTSVGQGAPFTLAVGDTIQFSGEYNCAPSV